MSTPTNSPFDIDDKLWQISEAFIDHYGLTTLHTASFDYAIEELIPSIIEEKGNISLVRDGIKHTVRISDICFTPPLHKDDNGTTFRPTPKMCVDSSLSYTAGIYVDITYIGPDNQINIYKKKYIGDIFIPVGCNLCTLKSIKNDHKRMVELKEDINSVGGYFIVKGAYKVIVPQVKCAHNKIHLYVGKNTSVSGKPKFSKYAEIKCGGLISHQTTVQVGICRKSDSLSVSIPYIDASIPIGIIFKALGLKNNKEIASFIFESEWFVTPPTPKHKEAILLLVTSLERSHFCQTVEDALHFIGTKGKKFNDKLKLPKSNTDPDSERGQIIDYALHILRTEFLSHIEPGEIHFIEKCIFLGRMTRKLLLCHADIIPISDRDHNENKRLNTTGMIIASHFYKSFCQLTGKIVACIDADIKKKKHINVCSYITQPYIITTSFLSAFLTNKWNNGAIIGISQPLDNFNYCASLSFLRKFVITLAKDGGKIELPRFLHGSQWGGSCMYETPEGKRVGLVQILPLCSIITVGCDANPVIELLNDMNIIHINSMNLGEPTIIFGATIILVNGAPCGYTFAPQEIVDTLRLMRRMCQINPTIAISYDRIEKEIRILTDAGRHVRGVITVENGELVIPESILNDIISKKFKENGEKTLWSYLMEKGYVGLIDKDEDNCIDINIDVTPSFLAEKPYHERIQYSYCEMTPDMLEGIGANTSPKNDCNQAPRNIYQAAMTKQAIGVPGLNHMHNKKGKWHALVYPQKPIVNTRIAKKVGLERVPMGQNATVVVMPWLGMNQEDSLILNEDATRRGFMCSYAYITHEAVISHPNIPGATKFEKFEIPDNENCNDIRGNMSKLVQNGQWCHVPKGQIVNKNDVIIGMTVTYESPEHQTNFQLYSHKKTKANISIIYDQKLPALIYSVFCGKNGDGYMCIKIVTRQFRRPMLGDKFAARHGQKGTAGAICPSKEMPFLVKRGYTPNILINPLAFPSRMTIGLFVEAILGRALTSSALECPEYNLPLCLDAKEGTEGVHTKDVDASELKYSNNFNPDTDYNYNLDGDASPFRRNFGIEHIKYIIKCIENMGINGFGEEEVMDPITGQKMTSLVFNGIVYYQRLKHMAVDKIHSRSTGSMHGLHRQPVEGRSKGGGFRIGHMERDDLIGSTRISLREGISLKLEQLKTRRENVWGWNVKNDGIISSTQVNFGMGDSKKIYKITLQDGRTIEGSINHPFYTESGEYSDVKNLIVGEDRLICTVNHPLVDIDKEIVMCKNWIWDSKFFRSMRDYDADLDEYNVFRKSLKLARLLGLLSSDGMIETTKGGEVLLYPDHIIDVETVICDIMEIAGIKPKMTNRAKVKYAVILPEKLASVVKTMGVIVGKRIDQQSRFPSFITKDTPLPILREYLGALFGGDGHTVCLSVHRDGERDLMKSVAFSWTRDTDNIGSLNDSMIFLQELLLLFDVKSTIQQPKTTTFAKKKGSNNKEIVLSIKLSSLINFSNNIGFRYCEHKALRLAAGVSYRMFRTGALRQRGWICERVDELCQYRKKKEECDKTVIRTKKYIEQAVKELKLQEPILHKKAIPDHKIVGNILLGKCKNKFRCQDFPNVDEYLEEIGAIHLFDVDDEGSAKCCIKENSKVVPGFALKLIDVREWGMGDMYDITVSETESYLANGVVAHNCMLAQGTPEMVRDRLFFQSDAYTMPVCQVCGMTAIDDGKTAYCRLCQTSKIVNVQLPFGTKLMAQEFSVLNHVARILTLPEPK